MTDERTDKMYLVYKHTLPDGKSYIGMTQQNPKKRWQNGIGYKNQSRFYEQILKYGWNNIQHEILFAGLTKEEAEQKEIEMIAKYNSNIDGYNIAAGGNIQMLSEKGRNAIIKHNKERILSDDSRGKISNSLIKYYKCHPVSEETRNKRSISSKGRTGYWNGKHFSEEHYLKIIKPLLKSNKDKRKKVMCIELGIVFDSICDAETQMNYKKYKSTIYRSCRDNAKTCGGYHWKYVD